MSRTSRIALIALVMMVLSPTGLALATARMPVGFYDDDSFRWSTAVPQNLLAAQKAGASILHVTADWSAIAPTKPANPLDGSDPAYKLADLDQLVRSAGRYGFQVMINISRTPLWANGNQAPNHPPKNLNDLTEFAHMLAARYNGAPNHGLVLRWSIWNEPNLGIFLTPQFVNGKIVSPAEWVKLYMAGYKGIKAGDKKALVAAGETSNQGRNKPLANAPDSVAPATFAHMVSQINPKLPFDAWATHPYPTRPSLPPTQKVTYPNVTLTTIDKFGASLQQWFHRRVPIWITEYAEQTLPQSTTGGVSYKQQASDVKLAMKMAAASPYVEMFIWFTFRDSPGTWQSGLETAGGAKKPSYAAFSAVAHTIDGQSQIVGPNKLPKISVYVPFLAYHDAIGSKLGVSYQVMLGKKRVAVGQSGVKLAANQSVTFTASFKPIKGDAYTVLVNVGDKNGQHQVHVVSVTTT
ncbi:MAG TPA: cellulase family glycosylhydrolase [Gaiellaceae bacterium]|nr:cellulase family glycosylhydrolase [Gaiellaceae bacterium]